MSQTLWVDRSRHTVDEKLRCLDQTNPQDAFYVGKIGTDSAQLNKYIKNLSKVHQTSQLDGPDSDGISPLHPYYSRDYRSTSHMRASLAKDRCFSRGPGVCFRVFLRSREDFSNSWKIMMFHHVWVQKNRPWAKPFDHTVLGSYFMKINDILTKLIPRCILCGNNTYRSCRDQ